MHWILIFPLLFEYYLSFEQLGPDGKANHGLKCYPGPVLTSILQLTPDLLRAVFDI